MSAGIMVALILFGLCYNFSDSFILGLTIFLIICIIVTVTEDFKNSKK